MGRERPGTKLFPWRAGGGGGYLLNPGSQVGSTFKVNNMICETSFVKYQIKAIFYLNKRFSKNDFN